MQISRCRGARQGGEEKALGDKGKREEVALFTGPLKEDRKHHG